MTGAPWYAWIAIGIGASLAAMIWPFRRGALGIAVNLVAGMGGAVGAGMLSYAILPWARHQDTPVRLFFAALGALGALVAVHVAYRRHIAPAAARARGPGVGSL
jgi:hypothetical protein